MISNYEIRENSLTRNSIFLLLLKADEQGRDAVMHELSAFCNLIDVKVKGFDYVFELSGITDDSMLEKVRKRIETLSSPFLGMTQTFDNNSKTATIELEKTLSDKTARIQMTKTNLDKTDNIKKKEKISSNRQGETLTVNLNDTGFPIEREKQDEMNFEDLPTDSSLVSGTEKRIEIGNTSLKIEKTMTKFKQEMPQVPSVSKPEETKEEEISQVNKLTPLEEENKTILSYSPEEMKGVSIDIEKPKTGLFGNLFGKIKTAISSKNTKTEKRNKSNSSANALAGLLKKADEEKGTTPQASSHGGPYKEENPFQNLGEGIIVKKGMLDDDNVTAAKQELSANSVTAKLQVDDIFAAETVCDFYANQPEGVTLDSNQAEGKESPLDILEKPKIQEEKTDTFIPEANPSENLSLSRKTKVPVQQNTEENNKEDLTLPSQIFTKGEVKQHGNTGSDKKEIPSPEGRNENVGQEETLSPLDKLKQNPQKIIAKDTNNSVATDTEPVKKISVDATKKEEKNMQEAKEEMKGSKNQGDIQNPTVPSPGKVLVKGSEKIDHTLHIATPAKDVKYRNYPIEMPLIPTYTFANMDISSIRFAHAMAMATLDDLGKGNNPFLLQGISGTGKTHFLHAMGYEISKKIPQAKILFTNGVRLSRGVQYLLERGKKDKLDAFFDNAEVLIVDDVHLTAVNEHNREYISKVLNDFLRDKKQIILSSKYPPESLKRFEELVNFKFSMGTIAELKTPNKIHFAKLTNKIVSASFLDLTEKQVQDFFSIQNESLGDVARNVKRVKVLSRRIESSGIKKMSYEDILKEITAINGENSESEIVKRDFNEITVLEKNKEGSWGNFGFFFPASHIDKFRWVAFAAQEAAKDMGIKGGFNYALKSAYSTEHIISSAFKIANICDLKGLKGAVILGPSFMECKEPIRDNFYDILTHMLEVMMIRCGTINFEDLKKPSAYIKMLGDILK